MKIQESLEHYGGEKHFIATQEMIDGIESVVPAAYKEIEFHNKAEQKEITPEEFDRLRAEIEGDAKPVEIEWKNIEQYGRWFETAVLESLCSGTAPCGGFLWKQ